MASSDSTESLPVDSGAGLGSPERIDSHSSDPSIAPGSCLGRYTVGAELGRGAMGRVFTAYDPELRRVIALKVLRPGLADASPGAVLRFQREAQAMARLNHPNVVSVYDVGMVDGRVFVAMELVEGPTLAAWLAERPRGWREIRDVFLEAGRGLAAAHAAGLVHRDFKPTNVVVGDRVRVADFGLARGADDPEAQRAGTALVDGARVTQTGAAVGTPAYMAPEQRAGAAPNPLWDQYSFGVALREALGGRPDGRLASGRAVPRWLRAIVERTLSEGPGARYPSMRELLTDLSRDPALARRRWLVAGAIALFGVALLWARRDGGAPLCNAASARLAGVWDDARRSAVKSAFGATQLAYADDTWRRASEVVDRYAARWVDMSNEACRATHVEGRQSSALLDLRTACLDRRRGILASLSEQWLDVKAEALEHAVDAAHALPPLDECADARALTERVPMPADPALVARIATVRARLDAVSALLLAHRSKDAKAAAAAARHEADAVGFGPVQAEAVFDEGRALADLGEPGAASRFVEAARLAGLARDDRLVARAQVALVESLAEDRQNAAQAALAADLAEGSVARTADPGLRAKLVENRGLAFFTAGKYDAAFIALTAARVLMATAFGDRSLEALQTAGQLGRVAWARGSYGEARQLGDAVLAATSALFGPEHPRIATTLNNIAIALEDSGDHDAAAAYHRRALALKEKIFGPDAPSTAITLNNLGIVEDNLGHYDEARALYERALAIRERALGPEHPYVATTLGNLAEVARKQGKPDEALALLQRALAVKQKAYGPVHASVATSLAQIGQLYGAEGDTATALDYERRALDMREKVLGADHPATLRTTVHVAGLLADLRRCPEARPLLSRAIAGLEKTVGPRHRDLADAQKHVAECDLADGKSEAAVRGLEAALAILDENKAQPVERGYVRWVLARALWALGRRDAAVATARLAATQLSGDADGVRELAATRAWLAGHAR